MRERSINVGTYYDQLQILYDIFYSKGTLGLHYGLWNQNTKTIKESILNTNKVIAELLEISDQDIVLDAGCGIGGTCIYLGERYNAQFIGITLSKKQLKKAQEKSQKKGLKNITFYRQDYTKTKFNDETFTKIYAIESVCHAKRKLDFLKEAYRLLKKGGRLAVSDGFLVNRTLDKDEKEVLKKCLRGWGVQKLATKEEFHHDLKKAGFKKIRYFDKFQEIKKTRDRIYRLGLLGYPFSILLYKIGVISQSMHENTITCLNQKRLFADNKNIATYGIFVAEK